MYESPPPLKFPSLAIIRRLTKRILDELSVEENEILQSKRSNIVFRQFDGGNSHGGASSLQKNKRKTKVTNACQNCKKSKTGCDGYLPCDNCSKRSKSCEYPPGVSPPLRPPPPSTNNPLPTPTEQLTEPIIMMSHDVISKAPPKPPAFMVSRFSTQQQQQQVEPPPPPPLPLSTQQQQQQQQQQQHYFPVPESVTLVTENNVDVTTPISPTQQRPQACTDRYGHFTGDTTFFIPQQSAPLPAGPTTSLPNRPSLPPFLSADIQISLIDTFYTHANPFFPAIMSKDQMFAELDLLRTDQPSQLSQLFFHAVFSRAASLTSGEDFVQQLQDTPEEKTWSSISGTLLSSAFIARDDYLDSPHISTLLALVIMANHFEHNKLAKNLRKAWMLIGDAGRLAIDMGLHRSSRLLLHSNGEDDVYTQMCIRTFWAVCVSERTMSITYGRPSMFDDKDIDVPPPKSLPSDDEHTKDWVESLRQLVIMSNIACRIMRFNYAAQTQFSGPLRVNAAASTIDCWMCSESDSDLEDRLHHGLETTTMDTRRKRLDDLEALYFFSNLIQLHKPFMHQDGTNKGEAGRPSFVVCHLAAIAISYITHTTPIAELADICKSPPTLYAIVKALQVHLENGSRQGESDRTIAFSEISFERTLSQLRKLPAIVRHPDDSSMLTETLDYMEQKYYQRTNTVVAGYLVSRHSHVDSPVPTLCSSNETSTVTSVSSVDGILHNNNHVSPHSSSLLPSTTVITQHQLLQQGSDWSSSTTVPTPSATSNNLTFVNVDPAIKGSSLGKRRLRETNISRKLPPSNLTPHSHKFRSNQHQKTEPLLTSPSSTINSIMGTSHYHYHHHHQEEHNHHVQQQLSTSQPVPINPFYDFMSMDNNNIMYQQGQQQQQPTKQQPPIISPLTNDTNNINNNNNNNIITTTTITSTSLDTHPSLYPETQIIPQRLEQDPDLPSAILNEELWSTTNNGYC